MTVRARRVRFIRAVPVVLLALSGSGAHAQQSALAGHWEGYWQRAGDTMPATLAISYQPSTARYSVTFGADRLRVSGIPFDEVTAAGCCALSMTIRGDRTTMVFKGRVTGDRFDGTFGDSDGEGTFAYRRVADATAPFDEHDVTFSNAGVTLAGTILLPRSGGSVPGVVFLHGSGGEGRWASRFVATQLAQAGVASLIFDKRGVGGSGGDWRQASLEDLAADDSAAVDRLRQEPRVDPRRVGIHGHSQGGTIAPMVATRSNGVAFVIGSAAAGIPMDSTEIYSIENSVLRRATSAADSANARDYTAELVGVAYRAHPRARLDSLSALLRERPWYFAPPAPEASYWTFSKTWARYQPLEWWAKVRVPVLLVYGGADERVPPTASAERIAATLRAAGNTDVTARIFPGADHTFRLAPGPGGWPRTAPDYLPTLVDWLRRR